MPLLSALLRELDEWLTAAVMACPGTLGQRARIALMRRKGAIIGRNCRFGAGFWARGARNLRIGDDSGFERDVMMETSQGHLSFGSRVSVNARVIFGADFGRIDIGDNVIIGMNTVFRVANHRFDRTPDVVIRDQGHDPGEIVIAPDVWIGANVTILSNVHVGAHSVIAAGAVVHSDVPPLTLVGGVPAKIIRSLDPSISQSNPG